jgi:pimeloyl-ACP methyl ester carboxylesterase
MSLYCEVKGSGAPVLFLHQGIVDGRVWDNQWVSFAPSFKLVRCDLAGFGRSPISDVPISHARDVAAALDEIGVSGAAVVGGSLGGRVALELAVGRPDLVRALVLVAAALPGVDWSQEMRAYGAAEDDAMAAQDLDAATELNLRMWVDGPGRTAAEVDPAVRAAVAEMQRRALELQAPHWEVVEEQMLVPDIGERLGAVHVPTLVLVGEEDVDDFQRLAKSMADEIPGARLATIPGTAHVPNLERPLAFDAVVLEFLADAFG